MGSVWILWAGALAGWAGDGRPVSRAYSVTALSSVSFGAVCVACSLTSFVFFLHTLFRLQSSNHPFLGVRMAYACPDIQLDALAANVGGWIFRGYVHAGNIWVGRWQRTETAIADMGFEGGFTLARDW